MKHTKRETLRNISVTGIFAAIAAILMMLDFSLPLMPSFLKFDISLLPVIIVAFAYGPLYGLSAVIIKDGFNMLMSPTLCIGELSDLLLSATFVIAAGIVYRYHKSKKGALAASVCGTSAMTLLSVPINLLIIYPLYIRFVFPEQAILGLYQAVLPSVDALWKGIIIFNLPFTLIKGIVVSALAFAVYKRISPLIKK